MSHSPPIENSRPPVNDRPSHTPGPWEVYPAKSVWLVMPISVATDTEADALLIAAAPDMLKELESAELVLTECANILRPKWPSLADNIIGAHLTKIRAAIARATGLSGDR